LLLSAKFVKHSERFLRLAQRKDRNQRAAATAKSCFHRVCQFFFFRGARPTSGLGSITTGAFHDQDVDIVLRKNRRLHDCLIIEIDVAGVKDLPPFRAQKNSRRTEDVAGIPKLESQRVVVADSISAGGIRLSVATQLPKLNGAIGFAMTEKWINRESQFLTLPRHHVYGIMEKKRADFAGRFRHENARMGLAPHQYRERSDVILMRVSDQNRVDGLAVDRLPIRQRILAGIFGMHPAIENQPRSSRLEVVRVGTDLSMSSEIDELHAGELL